MITELNETIFLIYKSNGMPHSTTNYCLSMEEVLLPACLKQSSFHMDFETNESHNQEVNYIPSGL